MCRNLDAVAAVQEANLSATQYLCKAKKDGCPFSEGCPYVAQMGQAADVWLVTHSILNVPKPSAIGLPMFLVMDEPTLAGAITGLEGKPRSVSSISLPTTRQEGADDYTHKAFWNWPNMAEAENGASRIRTMLEQAGYGITPGEKRPQAVLTSHAILAQRA